MGGENESTLGLPKAVLSILANMERHKDTVKWNISDSSQNSFTLSLTWKFKRNKTMKWDMWFKVPPIIEEVDQKLRAEDYVFPDLNGGLFPDQIPGVTIPDGPGYMPNGHLPNGHVPVMPNGHGKLHMGQPDIVNTTKRPKTATVSTQTNITLKTPLSATMSQVEPGALPLLKRSQSDMVTVSTQANVRTKEHISYVDNFDSKLSRSMSFRNKPDIDKPKDKSKFARSHSFRNNFKLLQWMKPGHKLDNRSPSRSIQSDTEHSFHTPPSGKSRSRSYYEEHFWSPSNCDRDRVRTTHTPQHPSRSFIETPTRPSSMSSSSIHHQRKSTSVHSTPGRAHTPTPRPRNCRSVSDSEPPANLHMRHQSWTESTDVFSPTDMQDLSRISKISMVNPTPDKENGDKCSVPYPRSPVPGRVPGNKRVVPAPEIPKLPADFKLDDDKAYLSDSTESLVEVGKTGSRRSRRHKRIDISKCILACEGILSSDV